MSGELETQDKELGETNSLDILKDALTPKTNSLDILKDALTPKSRSLTDLMTKKEGDNLVNDTVVGDTYRNEFAERKTTAKQTEDEFFNNRDKLDERDNKLLNTLDNIAKKYNVDRGELAEYAVNAGWIPKTRVGLKQAVLGVGSDMLMNADVLAERKLQDQVFEPEGVQALVETRRAVQESVGPLRQIGNMVGEFGAGVLATIGTGGAAAPVLAASVARRLAKAGAYGAGAGALSGASQGMGFSDTSAAKRDEDFERQQKEVDDKTEADKNFVQRAGSQAMDATIGALDQNFDALVGQTIGFQEFQKNNPQIAGGVRGAWTGAPIGGVLGVGGGVVGEKINSKMTERKLAKAEPSVTALVDHMNMEHQGTEAIMNSVVVQPDGTGSEQQLTTRRLLDDTSVALNNGLTPVGKYVKSKLFEYRTELLTTKKVNDADFAPTDAAKSAAKHLETIINSSPEVLNNIDEVAKKLGQDAEGSRSPLLSQFKADLNDRSFNYVYQLELLDTLKAAHINPKTREEVVRLVGVGENNPNNVSDQFLKISNELNKDRIKSGDNLPNVEATLADRTKLILDEVLGGIKTLENKLTEEQFNKGYIGLEKKQTTREIQELFKQQKHLDKMLGEYERDLSNTSNELSTRAAEVEQKLNKIVFENADESVMQARKQIFEAVNAGDTIPQNAIDTVAKLADTNKNLTARDVQFLSRELGTYNTTKQRFIDADQKFDTAYADVASHQKLFEKHPDLLEARFSDVQKQVQKYATIAEKAAEKSDIKLRDLNAHTDMLVFGSTELKEQVLAAIPNSKYQQLVDNMLTAMDENKFVPQQIIDGFKELSQNLKVNSNERKQVYSVVKSLDEIDNLAQRMDLLVDTVEQLNTDKAQVTQTLADVRSVAIDQQADVAARIAIVNNNLRQLGHNPNAIRDLTKLRAELEPILQKRMDGAGLSSKERQKITLFLEGDLFARVRRAANGDPSFVVYSEEHVDNIITVRAGLTDKVRQHIATVYETATGKPLPEATFYGNLVTVQGAARGDISRIVEGFEAVAAAKQDWENGGANTKRIFMNSEMADTEYSNKIGLSVATDTDLFLADAKTTHKTASNLNQIYFKTIEALGAFDGTRYNKVHNSKAFVYLRHLIVGTMGADLKKFPMFVYDYEKGAIKAAPAFLLLKEFSLDMATKSVVEKPKIAFNSFEVVKLAEKYFPERATEAANYFADYFGKYDLDVFTALDAPTLDLALQSAMLRKQFDFAALDRMNQERVNINSRRGLNEPQMARRVDRVSHVLKAREVEMNIAETFEAQVYNHISSSADGQANKTMVKIEDLVHPDVEVVHNTHATAKSVLMSEARNRLQQAKIIASRMGYTVEAERISVLLQGQKTELTGGVSKILNNLDAKFSDSFAAPGYHLFKTVGRTLGSSTLSLLKGQFWNIAQATSYQLMTTKGSKKLPVAVYFPFQVGGNITLGVLKDIVSGIKKVPSGIKKFASNTQNVLTGSTPTPTIESGTFPFNFVAKEMGIEVGSTPLRDPNALHITSHQIVEDVLREAVEADNTNQLRSRTEMAAKTSGQSATSVVGSTLNQATKATSWLGDMIAQQFKERVETAMLRTNFSNAARIWQNVVEDAIKASKSGQLKSVEAVAKHINDNWMALSPRSAEHTADIARFANKIANEFSKPHEKRNYYNGLQDFLRYSNNKMQGRFGSLSNPLFINNVAQSLPSLNQFFSAATNGIYKPLSLATQSKGPNFARNVDMAMTAAQAVTMMTFGGLLQFGNKRVADFSVMENDHDLGGPGGEEKRNSAAAAAYWDLLLRSDPLFKQASYKLLRQGTGLPFFTRLDPLGGSLGMFDRFAKSYQTGFTQPLTEAKFGGLNAGILLGLGPTVYKSARLGLDEMGLVPYGETEEDYVKNREEAKNVALRTVMSLFAPTQDLVKSPYTTYRLFMEDGFYKDLLDDLDKQDKAMDVQVGASEIASVLQRLGVERAEILRFAQEFENHMNVYQMSGGTAFGKDFMQWRNRAAAEGIAERNGLGLDKEAENAQLKLDVMRGNETTEKLREHQILRNKFSKDNLPPN